MVGHEFPLRGNVCGRKMRQLECLRFDPAQMFQIFEKEVIFG